MELYKEILRNALINEDIQITFPNLQINPQQIIESECYQTLQKIKTIIEDESLEDDTCFMKIEEIISSLEHIGIDCGTRHDFY